MGLKTCLRLARQLASNKSRSVALRTMLRYLHTFIDEEPTESPALPRSHSDPSLRFIPEATCHTTELHLFWGFQNWLVWHFSSNLGIAHWIVQLVSNYISDFQAEEVNYVAQLQERTMAQFYASPEEAPEEPSDAPQEEAPEAPEVVEFMTVGSWGHPELCRRACVRLAKGKCHAGDFACLIWFMYVFFIVFPCFS